MTNRCMIDVLQLTQIAAGCQGTGGIAAGPYSSTAQLLRTQQLILLVYISGPAALQLPSHSCQQVLTW